LFFRSFRSRRPTCASIRKRCSKPCVSATPTRPRGPPTRISRGRSRCSRRSRGRDDPLMAITSKDVEEIAQLARLALDQSEIALYTRQLGDILGYIEKLRELDTSDVEGTTHAVPMDCPLREDELGPRLGTADALLAAPAREGDFFAVPKIIEVG